jgi:hypothetical protein
VNLAAAVATERLMFPNPESLSKFQITVLEIEGIVLNILIFCRLVHHERFEACGSRYGAK